MISLTPRVRVLGLVLIASSVLHVSSSAQPVCPLHARCVPAPYSIEDLTTLPQVRMQIPPAYPAALRAQRVTGRAVLQIVVDESGHVADVQSLDSTHPLFAESAIAAIKHWQFTPGVKDGRSVSCVVQIPLIFTL